MPRLPVKLLVCALVVLTAAACKKEQGGGAGGGGDVIRVGEVGSLTGNEATFGISSDRGIRLALNELNAAGGIKGRKVEVITLDDEGKPEQAATATTRLISSDHVIAILGEVASSRSRYMGAKAQAAKIPMVTPSSTNKTVTEIGDYIFRACYIDEFQGYVMAKFAADTLKVKSVAILRDVRNTYSVGLADVFAAEFRKLGGRIVGDESFSAGDVDFKAQLTNLKGTKPEAIYVPAYYTDVGLIARQAREAGITVPLLGGDGWDSEKLHEIGGEAIEGSYFSNHYSVDDPSPRIQEFVGRFKQAFAGQVPDSLAAQAYDAAGMLFDAMKRAPQLTPAGIRDALAATKDYAGVTGNISIGPDRNPIKPAVVLKVGPGGKYEFAAKIPPQGVAEGAEAPPKKAEAGKASDADEHAKK